MKVKHEDTSVSGSWFKEYRMKFRAENETRFELCVQVLFEVFLDGWRDIRDDPLAVESQVLGHCRQWLEQMGLETMGIDTLPDRATEVLVLRLPSITNDSAARFESGFARPGVEFDVPMAQT